MKKQHWRAPGSRRRQQPDQIASLTESLCRRLDAYAVAAAAAGVAVVACAAPAEGAPVCTRSKGELLNTSTFPLYLINQQIPSFNIAQQTNSSFISFTTTGIGVLFWWNRAFFTPNSAGAKVLLSKNYPADVKSGSEIGPGGDFGKGASYGLLFTYGKGHFGSGHGGGTKLNHRGNLSLSNDSLVGFQVSEKGQVHYGWARLNVTFKTGQRPKGKHTVVHILGYGYETTPNTAIAAGSCGGDEKSNAAEPKTLLQNQQPASLGLLALGSEGVMRWKEPRF